VQKLAGEIPATLFLFDLVRDGDEDLRQRPLSERRAHLAALAARIGAAPVPEEPGELRPGPETRLTPWTDDLAVAERWYADEGWLGEDGILAKRSDSTYQAGVRGWVKVKHRRTTDCVVGGYRLSKDGDGVGSLLLGLYDDAGNLHYVGHTSSFRAAERRQLREVLAPLEGGAGFGGDAGRPAAEPVVAGRESTWVSLDPVLVCECHVRARQSGRFRHSATFVRWRDDRDPRSCVRAGRRGTAAVVGRKREHAAQRRGSPSSYCRRPPSRRVTGSSRWKRVEGSVRQAGGGGLTWRIGRPDGPALRRAVGRRTDRGVAGSRRPIPDRTRRVAAT
jgi:ATP-dependent DNA ligase